ncbi:Gfo/Idh/MocA family oxidoreductase [Winogradskya consettensis]|uniref:Dehydrogenase n=1 Tax=Winogradskya consettensis TaxID=113560 RepID=A0A919T0D9_9ACTN|nr:dehydrogenase [Actinoplanes consettensis]
MTRVAVIGRGDVSVVHLAAISQLGVELVDAGDQPDVVHVCTPHDQHVPVALEALRNGAHVLLEKPVANTVAEAEKLVGAYPGRKIGVCLQNRYNPTSMAAHDLIASGKVGAVRGASASVLWHRDEAYYRARPWRGQRRRSGGGVLINQAIHTLDLLLWLVGGVTRVRGDLGGYLDIPGVDVEDTAHLILDHAGGARSTFFATLANATDAPVTIEIVAEQATLLIRGDLTVTWSDGRTEVIAEQAASGGGRTYWGASHQLLIADFYRRLHDPEPFWIGPQEALKAQRLIEGLY